MKNEKIKLNYDEIIYLELTIKRDLREMYEFVREHPEYKAKITESNIIPAESILRKIGGDN